MGEFPQKPWLTIAIPTYNRSSYLKKSLENISEEILENNLNKEIEVIISDNFSDDNTIEVAYEFTYRFKFIRYSRNSYNMGPDQNFIKCRNLANGRFLLLLGDDDLFVKGGIKTIVDLIKKNKLLSLIVINSHKKVVSPNIRGTDEEFCFRKPAKLIFSDKDDFLTTIDPDPLTFMSSLIFNMQVLENIENYTEGTGSHFIHTIWLLKVLKINANVLVFPEPLIIAGEAESLDFKTNFHKASIRRQHAEYNQFLATLEFYSNFVPMICKRMGYRKLTSRKLFSKFLYRQSLMKVHTKIQGNNVFIRRRSEIFEFTKYYPMAWILFYPAILIPTRLLQKLYFFSNVFINAFL